MGGKIAGPPEFLNKSAEEVNAATQNSNTREGERKWRGRAGSGGKSGRDKKDLPAGIINLPISLLCVYFGGNHTIQYFNVLCSATIFAARY